MQSTVKKKACKHSLKFSCHPRGLNMSQKGVRMGEMIHRQTDILIILADLGEVFQKSMNKKNECTQ